MSEVSKIFCYILIGIIAFLPTYVIYTYFIIKHIVKKTRLWPYLLGSIGISLISFIGFPKVNHWIIFILLIIGNLGYTKRGEFSNFLRKGKDWWLNE